MEDRYVRRDVRTPARADVWDDASLAYARAVGVMQAHRPRTRRAGRRRPRCTAAARAARGSSCRGRACSCGTSSASCARSSSRPAARATGRCRSGATATARPSAALPGAFAAPALPDGSPNPLYRPDGERAACLNAGRPLPDAVTSAGARARRADVLAGPRRRPRHPGRGGGAGAARPARGPAARHGHRRARPGARRLDPVFPLHLANVDRLWEVWLARGEGRANPAHFDWADRAFCFRDADGRLRSLTCGQVGDLANLDYGYAGLPARRARRARAQGGRRPRPDRRLAAGAPRSPMARGSSSAPSCGPPGAGPGRRRPARGRRRARVPERRGRRGRAARPAACGRFRVGGGDGAAAVGTIAPRRPRRRRRRFVFDITDAVPGARRPDGRLVSTRRCRRASSSSPRRPRASGGWRSCAPEPRRAVPGFSDLAGRINRR